MTIDLISLVENEARVSHRVIALNTGNKEVSIMNTLNKYIDDFKEFGAVHFKNEGVVNNGKGDQPKTCFLNEQQATLLLTYLRNSSVVRAFKVALVKAFFKMRELLYQKETKDNKKVIAGYKSQLVQHNKKIELLQEKVLFLEKTERVEPFSVTEHRDDATFMNDSEMHNHFLDFMCMANIARDKACMVKETSKEFRDLHQSMDNFLLFMSKRYVKVRGVKSIGS